MVHNGIEYGMMAALAEGLNVLRKAPVLTAALYSRISSRGLDDFADKVLSAMCKGFGHHEEKRS
jgi:6-phosphogluconate dehydrogenase